MRRGVLESDRRRCFGNVVVMLQVIEHAGDWSSVETTAYPYFVPFVLHYFCNTPQPFFSGLRPVLQNLQLLIHVADRLNDELRLFPLDKVPTVFGKPKLAMG
jgi:hypothetical protein